MEQKQKTTRLTTHSCFNMSLFDYHEKRSRPEGSSRGLTWIADRHGVIDDLGGLQQQFDLPLWRVLQMELVQFDADLLHCRGLGDSSGYPQSGGGAAQHNRLTHNTSSTFVFTVQDCV